MSFFSLFWQASLMVKLVMLILIMCSLCSWTLIAYKFITFRNLKRAHESFWALYRESPTIDVVRGGVLTLPESPLQRIFLTGYHSLRKFSSKNGESIRNMMAISIDDEIAVLEREISFFATVGSISPFIGLFGTVWGIMNSFQAIGLEKNATIASVAPGIAEALFATALGLIVTIPAVVAYNMCVRFINRIHDECDHFSDEFVIFSTTEHE